MKTKITKLLALLLMMVLCTMMMAGTAFAAGVAEPKVSLPVTITLSGTLPSTPETFTVTLTAKDKSYPMPEGSEDGVYQMTITGADTQKFPEIVYNKVGIYTYTITQQPGSDPKCTYDSRVYNVKVTITNAADGSGLESAVVIRADSVGEQGDKSDVIFHNVYETKKPPVEPDPKPKPKPDPEPDPKPTPERKPIIRQEEVPEPDVVPEKLTPDTSDNSNLALDLIMCGVGVGVIAALYFTRDKKSDESEE